MEKSHFLGFLVDIVRDRFFKFMAEFISEQEARYLELTKQEKCSLKDILDLQFGGSPKGIDVGVGPELFQFHLKPVSQYRKDFNALYGSPFGFVLAMDAYATDARLHSFISNHDLRLPQAYMNRGLIAQYASITSMGRKTLKTELFVVSHEGIHAAQMHPISFFDPFVHSLQASYHNESVGETVSKILRSREKSNKGGYWFRESEVQAYMHNLVIDNYHRWGRLPSTKEELWAAMIDAGIRAPENIQKELNSSPEGREAVKNFSKNNFLRKNFSLIKIFNRGLRSLSKESLFWTELLPRHYSMLLEFYGDKLGRERFGLGKSNYAEREFLCLLLNKADSIDWDKKVSEMTSEAAPRMVIGAIVYDRHDVAEKLIRSHPQACLEWRSPVNADVTLQGLVAAKANREVVEALLDIGANPQAGLWDQDFSTKKNVIKNYARIFKLPRMYRTLQERAQELGVEVKKSQTNDFDEAKQTIIRYLDDRLNENPDEHSLKQAMRTVSSKDALELFDCLKDYSGFYSRIKKDDFVGRALGMAVSRMDRKLKNREILEEIVETVSKDGESKMQKSFFSSFIDCREEAEKGGISKSLNRITLEDLFDQAAKSNKVTILKTLFKIQKGGQTIFRSPVSYAQGDMEKWPACFKKALSKLSSGRIFLSSVGAVQSRGAGFTQTR